MAVGVVSAAAAVASVSSCWETESVHLVECRMLLGLDVDAATALGKGFLDGSICI